MLDPDFNSMAGQKLKANIYCRCLERKYWPDWLRNFVYSFKDGQAINNIDAVNNKMYTVKNRNENVIRVVSTNFVVL